MKITLDHNCIIHLKDHTDIGKAIEAILSDKKNNCFVVNVGASEMRERGVRPDHYEKFEELLVAAGIAHLPRLNPMMRLDVTFLGRSGLADDETIKLADAIEEALFGGAHKIAIASVGLDSPAGKTWLNRQCDVHGMWCHIRNGNEVFLTTDGNFKKQTKLTKLIDLGAGRICHPDELCTQGHRGNLNLQIRGESGFRPWFGTPPSPCRTSAHPLYIQAEVGWV